MLLLIYAMIFLFMIYSINGFIVKLIMKEITFVVKK